MDIEIRKQQAISKFRTTSKREHYKRYLWVREYIGLCSEEGSPILKGMLYKVFGTTPNYMREILSIEELIPSIKQLIANNQLGISTVYLFLSKLTDQDQNSLLEHLGHNGLCDVKQKEWRGLLWELYEQGIISLEGIEVFDQVC